jgi:phospholipase/carboxylesterase
MTPRSARARWLRGRLVALACAIAALAACERPPAPSASTGAAASHAAPPPSATAQGRPTSAGAPAAAVDALPGPPRPAGVAEGQAAGVHYLERVVGGAKPDDRLPMVVMIHGLGDRPDSFLDVLAGSKTPARLVLPRGLDAHGDGWAWFPYRRGVEPEVVAEGIRNAADRVAAAIGELARRRPTAGKPVISGFSQGGMISFAVAALHPGAVSAAYPLSGMLPAALRPKAPPAGPTPPLVAFHGTDDSMVPIAPARDTVAALKAHGWRAELREAAGVGHTVPAGTRDAVRALIEAAAAGEAAAR